jgi:predicted PurR-regulated permease PerM
MTKTAGADGSEESSLGEPGPPLSRRAPFYQGFLGTLGVLAALLVGFGVREASSALTLILIAAFLAIGLNPLVEFALHRGVKRGWAVTVVAVGVLTGLTVLILVIGSTVRAQLQSFIDDAPQLLEDLRRNRSVAHFDAKYHFISALEKRIKGPDFTKTTLDTIFSVGLSAINIVFGLVIVFILTLYFLAALPQLTRAAYSLAPASRRERVSRLGDEILRRVGGFVIGSVLVAFIAGTVTLIFTLLVGLGEYALPLALLVALLDLVPLVGAIIGATSVCLVGLATSLPIGIVCIAFYLVYEVVEGYVIYPRVMRSSVDVPEYVTIVAVLVGGTVAGIVGALLALPIAAALLLLVREVWVRRQDLA